MSWLNTHKAKTWWPLRGCFYRNFHIWSLQAACLFSEGGKKQITDLHWVMLTITLSLFPSSARSTQCLWTLILSNIQKYRQWPWLDFRFELIKIQWWKIKETMLPKFYIHVHVFGGFFQNWRGHKYLKSELKLLDLLGTEERHASLS